MVRGWKLWTFGGILAAVVLVLFICIPIIHGAGVSNAQTAADAKDPLEGINVIDLALLVSRHPDAPRLQALDNEIGYLQGQEGRAPDGSRITEEAYKEL